MRGPVITLTGTVYDRPLLDKDGKIDPKKLAAAIVLEKRSVDTNSWLKQAAQLFLGYFSLINQTTKEIGGSNVSMDVSDGFFMSTVANSARGVLVGSVFTALDRDDFNLETKINDGSGAGQLVYQSLQDVLGPISITGGYRVTQQRIFDNVSGGTIIIKEAGIHAATSVGASSNFFTYLRDQVTPNISVLDNQSLLVQYHFDFKI